MKIDCKSVDYLKLTRPIMLDDVFEENDPREVPTNRLRNEFLHRMVVKVFSLFSYFVSCLSEELGAGKRMHNLESPPFYGRFECSLSHYPDRDCKFSYGRKGNCHSYTPGVLWRWRLHPWCFMEVEVNLLMCWVVFNYFLVVLNGWTIHLVFFNFIHIDET
ncbi:hypothetical protein TNIN_410601 [Trichonephila inaurata madagascariensis]|uniref:Uncharacterized protein n=1 Tax=Trichonephila inaurata madagascariensis TaxID=2747483 RepID=A0A8X6YJB3_9ARAC|nr:hypothetical protein TNIN_410601 [Trichonephila inaurata madagascariensis]